MQGARTVRDVSSDFLQMPGMAMPVLLPLQRENFLFSLLKSPLPKLTCNRIQEYREESGYREVMIKDYFLENLEYLRRN